MKYDYVAQLPQPIVDYQESEREDEEIAVEKGFVSAIQGKRYFIHSVATIPVKDIESNFGYGLWVEVSREDFFEYLECLEEDKKYSNFECNGNLANTWLPFNGTYNDKVKIRVVDVNKKIFITDIWTKNSELIKLKEVGSLSEEKEEELNERLSNIST